MDETCPIQILAFSCIKNETTEVVSQKSNFKGDTSDITFSEIFSFLIDSHKKENHWL